MKFQGIALWVLLWMTDTILAVIIWTCPKLHLLDAVSCTCDAPHTLRCSGTCRNPETLKLIASTLKPLSEANSVTVLGISLRNLTSIPDRVFQDSSLHGLIVSSHEILRLSTHSFHGLEGTLLALGLPHNNLTSIPAGAIGTMSLLEKLDLSNNKISRISQSDLSAFVHLEELDLGHNHISEIKQGSFASNRNLKKLILDGNGLKDLGAVTAGMEALEVLYLQHNALGGNVSRETLPHLPSLTKLNVAFNNLEGFSSGAFAELHRLQFLDASHNVLTSIEEGAFRGLKNLMKLDLSHNRLSHLSEKTFLGLTSLAYLDLNDNYLSSIGDNLFRQLRSVRFINMRDNEIAHIHASAFMVTQQLESLDLEDNSLQCDCKMKGFASWLKTKAPFPVERKRAIICDSPAAMNHQVLMDVPPHEFLCSDKTPPESLAEMREAEQGRFDSVSDSGPRLVDYDYTSSDGRMTLTWLVDRTAQPYRCDAIFIFEEFGGIRQMWRKIQIECDSRTEPNPTRLKIQPRRMVLDPTKTYQFCLVLFSSTILVPGCSEPLRLHLGPSGTTELVGETTEPEEGNSSGAQETSSPWPAIRVHESADSVAVLWSFAPTVAPPSDLCTVNVSLRVENQKLLERRVMCSGGIANFTHVVLPRSYRVCVAVWDPAHPPRRDTHCVDVRRGAFHQTPATSGSVVATVIGTLPIVLALVLLTGIFCLARRMFRPTKKSLDVLSVGRSGAQYSVLYHQPDDGRTATRV